MGESGGGGMNLKFNICLTLCFFIILSNFSLAQNSSVLEKERFFRESRPENMIRSFSDTPSPEAEPSEFPEIKETKTPLPEITNIPGDAYYSPPEIYPSPFEESVIPTETPLSEPTAIPSPLPTTVPAYPVYFFGEQVFYIMKDIAPHTAEERAKIITERLEKISDKSYCRAIFIKVVKEEKRTLITYKKNTVMTITDEEAESAGLTRDELADNIALKLQDTIKENVPDYNKNWIMIGIITSLIFTVLIILFFRVTGKIYGKAYEKLDLWRKKRPTGDVRYQSFTLISEKSLLNIIIILTNVIHVAGRLIALYIYFGLVFGCFAETDDIGADMMTLVIQGFTLLWEGTRDFLPSLFFILIIIFVAYNITKFFHIIFSELENETLKFPGFHKEWAGPTFKIVCFFIVVFTIVVIFPSLPGYNTPTFKGISVMLGIIISLGSTTVMGDIIAGIILIYMKAFETGDRIKVLEVTGDVIEKSLLATTIQTIENTCITIPNSKILANYVINYTTLAETEGLVLNTTVTIGYDVPWKDVHKSLKEAALLTENVLREPAPFVLQTALNDFNVSYELRAYTDKPGKMAITYSEIHKNIQDKFNEAGIEILSPHYRAVRDGNENTTVFFEKLKKEPPL